MRRLAPLLLLAACTPAPPAPVPTPTPVPSQPSSDPVPTGKFLFYEDFEAGTDRWQLPATGWHPIMASSCGGKYAMILDLAPGDSSFSLKQPLDLSTAVRPVLKYDVKGVTTPPDAVTVQAEIRPPGQDWRPVGHATHGDHVFVAGVVADLTAYAGQAIGLRFHATVGAAEAVYKGYYLDDIEVIEPR
jgi:hypothetical protein